MPTWAQICSSVIRRFSRISPSIRAITSGVMARWPCPWRESSCSDVRPSQNLFCYSCTLARDIQCSPYTADMQDEFRVFQHPQPPRNEPHLSALLCLPPFLMLDEHTLQYAHLLNNKQTTGWACVFSLCMSPILQLEVPIHNNSVVSFREECVLWPEFGFHLTAPHIKYAISLGEGNEREYNKIRLSFEKVRSSMPPSPHWSCYPFSLSPLSRVVQRALAFYDGNTNIRNCIHQNITCFLIGWYFFGLNTETKCCVPFLDVWLKGVPPVIQFEKKIF